MTCTHPSVLAFLHAEETPKLRRRARRILVARGLLASLQRPLPANWRSIAHEWAAQAMHRSKAVAKKWK